MVKMSLGFLSVMVPLQVLVGDLHGLNTLEHQPAKIAAMEGIWETERGVAASLFAIPDEAAERNRYEIAIPKLASWYLTHDWDGEIKGLKEWPREDRPPVAIVYFAFRIMVGMGLLMLAVVIVGWVMHFKRRLYESPLFLRLAHWSMPIGFLAVLAGWTVTEVGRQPWVIYGLMRTREAVSPSLTTFDVALSLTLYVVAYVVIFGGGFVLLRRMVRAGPPAAAAAEAAQREPSPDEPSRPARPLSAATEAPLSGAVHGRGRAA
jgi:cytochrome d ubiquinol oxidase subunit I